MRKAETWLTMLFVLNSKWILRDFLELRGAGREILNLQRGDISSELNSFETRENDSIFDTFTGRFSSSVFLL